MPARRCGSRVEGVVRSCDTAFRPEGNIIEHYVYRFVAAGRACLVSNLAKSCYTECCATLHGCCSFPFFFLPARWTSPCLCRGNHYYGFWCFGVAVGAVINRPKITRNLSSIIRHGSAGQGSRSVTRAHDTSRSLRKRGHRAARPPRA